MTPGLENKQEDSTRISLWERQGEHIYHLVVLIPENKRSLHTILILSTQCMIEELRWPVRNVRVEIDSKPYGFMEVSK